MSSPRWVERVDVDSAAMLEAAAAFRVNNRELWGKLGLEGQLTKVVHCRQPNLEDSTDEWTKSVDCPEVTSGKCLRCQDKRPGYTFRWLSAYWAKEYTERAMPFAWTPGKEGPPEIDWNDRVFVADAMPFRRA